MRINLLKPKQKPVHSLKRKALKMGSVIVGVNLAMALITADMGDSSLHPANFLGATNEAPLENKALAPNKDLILSDYKNLIADEFHIPDGLKDRVGFWFDVYTKYDNNRRIIHHSLYPWIIFKVVDVTDIINAAEPRVRWLRNVKADKHVAAEMAAFRKALTHLSRGKAVDTNDEYHVAIEKSLSLLPGTLKDNAKKALREVRVQTGQRNFFAEGLEVSPLYLKGMEEIFRNNRLPVELTRLPFVESSFNKHAKSKVGASGLWQFMDSTGRKFMIVQDHIDERTSPFKATEAAARLLKENHMILKRSWPLALTAWNHGPSGLRRAMKKAGSHDLSDIIVKGRSANFDFASSNFYSEFLAALFAERYHDEMFEGLNYEKELDLHTVKLSRSVGAKELLRLSGLTKEDFLLFNPDLKRAVTYNASVPRGFTLMLDDAARAVLKNLLSKESMRTSAVKEKLSEAEIVAL